jgi:ankyrin repeat protein
MSIVPQELPPDRKYYMFKSAETGNTAVIQWYLKHGMSSNIRTSDKTTPLMIASEKARWNAMRLLIKDGHADVNAQNKYGVSALHLLAFAPDTLETQEAVYYLLDHQAHINALNEKGMTPLIEAAIHGNAHMMRALVARGAKTDIVDKEGYTALTSFNEDFLDDHPNRFNVDTIAEVRTLLTPK